ncbi:serglycin isoform X1 [Ovis canadensis]|uniref:serglycin isoform X1 n=1 Tax=Ovis canadensis TaxID=37174 RepID=UPI00375132A3
MRSCQQRLLTLFTQSVHALHNVCFTAPHHFLFLEEAALSDQALSLAPDLILSSGGQESWRRDSTTTFHLGGSSGILQDKMGANNSSLTPLNYILKNWDRFDPQGLKKTHLVFLCHTAWPRYPLEDGEWWPVGGSLKGYPETFASVSPRWFEADFCSSLEGGEMRCRKQEFFRILLENARLGARSREAAGRKARHRTCPQEFTF